MNDVDTISNHNLERNASSPSRLSLELPRAIDGNDDDKFEIVCNALRYFSSCQTIVELSNVVLSSYNDINRWGEVFA
jgi:hypothetical protein